MQGKLRSFYIAINVSRKRICGQADILAQQLWNSVLEILKEIDNPLYNNCVPECVYRGFCPELTPCNNGKGRCNSEKYKQWRKDYIGNRLQIATDKEDM
jgi:hypothetical protein